MTLKSDAQGFLVGNKLTDHEAERLLGAIKGDTGQILAAILKSGAAAQRQRTVEPTRRSVSTPLRGADGRWTSDPSRSAAAARTESAAAVQAARAVTAIAASTNARNRSDRAAARAARAAARASGQARGADGRFGLGGGAHGTGGGHFGSLAGGFASAAGAAAAGADRLDPLLAAAAEARGAFGAARNVVSPVGRTLSGILGRRRAEDQPTSWLRRMWRELRGLRREEATANKDTHAGLKALKPGGSGGMLGGLGGLLGRLPGAGLLRGAGGLLGGLLRGGGGLLKGMLRRLPIVGGLFAALAGLGDDDAIANDPTLTPEQRRTARFRNGAATAGSIGGAVLGGALGAFAGPIGIAVGATLGGWLGGKGGELLGEPLERLYDGFMAIDFAGMFRDAWKAVGDRISERWDDLTKWLTAKFEPVLQALERISDFVSRLPGMGRLKDAAASAWDATRTAASDATSWAGKKVGDRWNAVKGGLVAAARAVGIDPGLLAQITGFESGFDPSARPVGANGVPLSTAHGLGQMTNGTWISTLRKHGAKYGVANAASLTDAQALAMRGNVGLQSNLLAELTGENVALGRKLGGGNDAANVYALHNLGAGTGSAFLRALAANPTAAVSSVLGADVIGNNKSLYGDGSISLSQAYGRMGQAMGRGTTFAAEARAMGAAPAVPTASTTGLVLPRSPAGPSPVVVPAAAADAQGTRLNSSPRAAVSPAPVSLPGQDVPDRMIAHIVTGGISKMPLR